MWHGMDRLLVHIMLPLMLIGFVVQPIFAANAAGAKICCDPEVKATMTIHASSMNSPDMSDNTPCHDTDIPCETCCMDAVSQTSMIDRNQTVSFRTSARGQTPIQSDQIPTSITADYIPPPPNT